MTRFGKITNGTSTFSEEKPGPFDRRSGRARAANETRARSVCSHLYWHRRDHRGRNFRARGNGGGRGTRAGGRVDFENAGAQFHSVVDNTCAPGFRATRSRTGGDAFV